MNALTLTLWTLTSLAVLAAFLLMLMGIDKLGVIVQRALDRRRIKRAIERMDREEYRRGLAAMGTGRNGNDLGRRVLAVGDRSGHSTSDEPRAESARNR